MTLIRRTITIVGSSSLVAGNIKNGVTIFGVKGTWTGYVDSVVVFDNSSDIHSNFGNRFFALSIDNYGAVTACSIQSLSYMNHRWTIWLSFVTYTQLYFKVPGVSGKHQRLEK